jgi:hypothetical protein
MKEDIPMRTADARQSRGAGFAVIRPVAAGGPCIAYEGAARDWWVHFALGSITRLRIITWLGTHPGEHKRTTIERALNLYCQAGEDALMAMRSCSLVTARIVYRTKCDAPKPGTFATWLWSVTEEGRRYLWRYGWVTGRLVPGIWREDTFYGSVDVCPCDALATHAVGSLLRPRAMSIARMLWTLGPITTGDIARTLAANDGEVYGRLAAWQKSGWTVRQSVPPRARRPIEARNPVRWRWRFTREGLQAMERHCHALRWAAQNTGYDVPPDDRFLLGEDQVHWYTVEFTTER